MRIAAIRFVNALPLVYGLEKEADVELSFESPSQCYKKLVAGNVDVALIPVLGLLNHSSIKGLKGLGIASGNRTESVFLFTSRPLESIHTVAADPNSLTSVELLKIVLKQKCNSVPKIVQAPNSDLNRLLQEFDAALLIGDQAILAEKKDYDYYDLGAEWYSSTGLPFVFAVWAGNRSLTGNEQSVLFRCYENGAQHFEEILTIAMKRLPVSRDFLERYYNENLHYRLNGKDYEGLSLFLTLAADSKELERSDIWL